MKRLLTASPALKIAIDDRTETKTIDISIFLLPKVDFKNFD